MSQHIKVFTGSSITVNRLADLLEKADIPFMIKDEVESGRLAGFGTPTNSVELYINATDVEKARAIYEQFND